MISSQVLSVCADHSTTHNKTLALTLPCCPQVKQVAAGGMHSVALSMDGHVYTTGVNDEGALGRMTRGPSRHL